MTRGNLKVGDLVIACGDLRTIEARVWRVSGIGKSEWIEVSSLSSTGASGRDLPLHYVLARPVVIAPGAHEKLRIPVEDIVNASRWVDGLHELGFTSFPGREET